MVWKFDCKSPYRLAVDRTLPDEPANVHDSGRIGACVHVYAGYKSLEIYACGKKVAVFVWSLATGEWYLSIGISFGIGTSSVKLYTQQFCIVQHAKRSNFIKFPEDSTESIIKFPERTKIPNVVVALDGSHIPINEPSNDPEFYFNRRHKNSILM